MDAEQREKYDRELFGWETFEEDALAAVMDGIDQAEGE